MEADSEFALLDLKEAGRCIPKRVTERVPGGTTRDCELRRIERDSRWQPLAVDPDEHRVRHSNRCQGDGQRIAILKTGDSELQGAGTFRCLKCHVARPIKRPCEPEIVSIVVVDGEN